MLPNKPDTNSQREPSDYVLVLSVKFHYTQDCKAVKFFISCNPQQQKNHKECTDVITFFQVKSITSETSAYKIC